MFDIGERNKYLYLILLLFCTIFLYISIFYIEVYFSDVSMEKYVSVEMTYPLISVVEIAIKKKITLIQRYYRNIVNIPRY